MAPDCKHQTSYHWVSDNGERWDESEKLDGHGHWECDSCMERVNSPMGTGMCPRCLQAIDAHEDVGTNHQACPPRRK